MTSESRRPVGRRSLPSRLIVWLLFGSLLILVLWMFFPLWPPDPRCAAMLVLPEEDTAIPLPANCTLNAEAPSDDMVRYLENERKRRGLVFKKWITCKTSSQMPKAVFGFDQDSRWLSSYVPLTYQFRRTIVILPYARPIPEGSAVVAEVCLMPKRRYISQIAGECNGKFAVWK
jgi:hypothetical protein